MKIVTTHSVFGFIAGAVLSPIVLFGVFFLLMRGLTADMKDMASRPPDLFFEQAAEFDWALYAPDSSAVTFSDLARGEVVFLNLWATWCRPCLQEMPGIQSLHDSLGERVRVVSVSRESPGIIAEFAAKQGYTFPMFSSREHPAMFDETILPVSFILSRDGIIRTKHLGTADWNHPKVVAYLESLL